MICGAVRCRCYLLRCGAVAVPMFAVRWRWKKIDAVRWKHNFLSPRTSLMPTNRMCHWTGVFLSNDICRFFFLFSHRFKTYEIKGIEDAKKNQQGFINFISSVTAKTVNLVKTHFFCRILGSPSTVHLLKVNNSQIMIGPVSTSVFLDKCHNSTIVFACQQLRCHSSSKCNLYVHITARGIIEDCNEIYFGPYTFEYHELEQHFKASNLTREVNNWKRIDDFNWLSKTETSPNFSFIPESQWKQFCWIPIILVISASLHRRLLSNIQK